MGIPSRSGWRSVPGSWDPLHVQRLYEPSTTHGIPILSSIASNVDIPTAFTAWPNRRSRPAGHGLHFFVDDYRFECVWKYPARYKQALRRASATQPSRAPRRPPLSHQRHAWPPQAALAKLLVCQHNSIESASYMGGRGGASGARGGGGGAAARLGARGIRDADLDYLRSGMRSLQPFREAFAAARAAGISPTKVATTGQYPGGRFPPVRIDVDHSGKQYLTDGRHRYAAAREAGAKRIQAVVREYGPRGGIRSEKLVIVPLK